MMLPTVTSCRIVAMRASRAMDEPLPASERLFLRVHLMMCARCALFAKQLFFLRTAEGRFAEDGFEAPPEVDASRKATTDGI